MKKILKNWSFLTASDVVMQLVGFLVLIKLARELKPEGYGTFSVILAISSIFAVIANFGMSQVIIREVARNLLIVEQILLKAIRIRFFSAVCSILCILIYFYLFSIDRSFIVIAVTIVITISLTAWDLAESIAFGKEIMKYSSFINIFSMIAWAAIIFLLPKVYFSLSTILIIYTFIFVIKSVIYFSLLQGDGFFSENKKTEIFSNIAFIKMSIPFVWLFFVGMVGVQIPILFLAKNASKEQVGFYSVGMKLIVPLTITATTAMRAIFPALSNMAVFNRQKFDHSIYKGALVIIAFGSIFAFLLTLISPFFIPLFFGINYLPSIEAFNYLIWFGVIYSVDVLLGNALSSSDNQNILAIIAVIDLLIALPIFYYSSFYGATYLAMSRLLVSFITLSYHLFVFKKLLKSNFKIIEWAFLLLFLVLMFILSIASIISLISLKILLFLIIYFIFYLFKASNFYKIPNLIKQTLN